MDNKQNRRMMILKNITFALSATLLLSCVSKTQEVATLPLINDRLPTLEIPRVEESSFDEGRPVDIAPLVSNYLAARLSEREGHAKDAAFFYSRAEVADPQNKILKEHGFMLQLALGNMDEALRLAHTIMTQKTPMPIAFILLGADAIRLGELDEAKRYFNRAKAVSPLLLQFHVLQAYIDLAQGKPVDAVIEKLKKVPFANGLSAVRHFHFGRLLEKAGRLEEAQKEYEFSLEADTTSSFTILALERLYEKTNQQEKLQIVFDAFMKANPENVMLLKSVERLKSGAPYPVTDITLSQDTAAVIFEIATLMSSQKLPVAASQVINIAMLLNENNSFITFYKGVLQEHNRSYGDALETYQQIKNTDDTWLGAQIRITDIYVKQNKIEKAIAFISTLEKSHSNIVIRRILAGLYYSHGDYEKAIELYDTLLKNIPSRKDFSMYFARGASYERLSKFKEAERDLKESLRIMPNNATALNYLGYMWIERDANIEEAFALIGRALLIKPNSASILDSMGWVLYKKANYEKAVLYLERAKERRPTDATIHMHLGDVYEKLERFEEAYVYWQRALELKPETKKDTSYLKLKLNKSSAKLK